jgi:hypothetical protein
MMAAINARHATEIALDHEPEQNRDGDPTVFAPHPTR